MPEVNKKIDPTFDQFYKGKPEQQNLVVDYTEEELQYRSFMIERLEDARDQREQDYTEFNDRNYTTWYDENAKAGNSYNPPKANKEDTRIVTGTTQEKENTLLSALLNYNLEPNITAYNKNNVQIMELGHDMEDMVKKSRDIENYDEKRPLVYKELLDQGTIFVEEVKVENIRVIKTMKGDAWKQGGVNFSKIKWERKLKKMYAECEINILEGKKVYLGNMREFFINKQPFIFTRELIPYVDAKYIYGDWDRWKNVPSRVVHFEREDVQDQEYRDWTLLEFDDLKWVEVIKYQDPLNNEFMILLNGVMMLPIGFPLTAISPSGRFTIAKGDIEPISRFFAISKSIPAKTKVDQALLDETLRLMILEMQKSFTPPMANNTGRVLSRKVLYPATITNDIDADKLQPIGQVNGVTQAQMNTFEMLKRIIDEKSVSATFGGDLSASGTTATEIKEVKKQQMMKLGATILGVIALERQLSELRIYNILSVWTEAVDEKVDETRKTLKKIYRTVSIDTVFENGQRGEKIINFDPDLAKNTKSDEIADFEDDMKKKGRNVRITLMNPEVLKSIETHWNVSIVPTERDSSSLDRVLFVQNIRDAAEIFGLESINMENAKERFAVLNGEDPEKFWTKPEQQGPPPGPEGAGPPGAPPGPGGDIAAQIAGGASAGVQAPSLNTLAQG